jgi:hypothetical protein
MQGVLHLLKDVRQASMRRLLILSLALLIGILAGGCATLCSDEDDGVDEKPWNAPAGWEGQTLGVPY